MAGLEKWPFQQISPSPFTDQVSIFIHGSGEAPEVRVRIVLLHKLHVGGPDGKSGQLLLLTLVHLAELLQTGGGARGVVRGNKGVS